MSIRVTDPFGQPLNRRRFLAMSGAAGMSALLAACAAPAAAPASAPAAAPATTAPSADQPAQAAPAAGDVKLDFLNENWGDIYNKLMEEISTDYKKEKPTVTVDWNFDPEWQTKLTTLLAAGTPPDAVIMRPGPLANLASKGQLLDLSTLIQQSGVTRDDFVTPIYDSGTYNGKQYAVPGGADYICLFYSKSLYQEAGLDPEKPPLTTEEFMAHSKAIFKKDAGGDIQRIGYIPASGHLINWSYIFGGKFFDSATNKITANDAGVVAALEYMTSFVSLYDVNKLAAFNSRPGMYEAGNPFSTKQSAYALDGFWTYEAMDQYSPDINYGVSFWPTLEDSDASRSRYAISGWMYSIPAQSKNVDAAWDFLRYAFIEKSARMGYLTLNGPCIKKAFTEWEEGLIKKMGATNRMANYLPVFSKTGALATNFFPIIPVQSFYTDQLTAAYDKVIRGEMTAKAALDEVTTNVQAELDKAMKGA